ncbi:MAG: IS110 family transposase [Myxococcota bacterium]
MTHRDVRRTTLGIDLGDKQSDVCVLGSEGAVVRRFRVKTTSSGFQGRLAHWAGARAVVEVGTHSPWVSRLLSAMGFEVIVANANKVGLIGHSFKKTDAHDAEVLAKLGQLDPSLLSPIQHRSETAQKDLMMLRARDGVVASRTQMVNSVRGFVKALGQRCPSSSTSKFTERVRESLEEGLFPGLAELLEVIDVLSEKIRVLDQAVKDACHRYPATSRLQQISGVGATTALCYVLTLEDPRRFGRSRDVGSFLGLVPRQRESGERKPRLRITKAGDRTLRRLMVQAAQYILGPFGPETDLRAFGLALAERSGKKKGVVATARKLSILLHHLWVTGADYRPQREVAPT